LALVSTDIEGLINETIKMVEKIVFRLPKTLDIMDLDSVNNFAQIQDNRVNVITIQLQKLILFSVENEMIKEINKESDKLEEDLNTLIGTFKNKSKSIELVDFDSETELAAELREELFQEKVALVDSIETRFQKYISVLQDVLEQTHKLLDYDFISENIKTIDAYIKRKEVQVSKLNRYFRQSKTQLKKLLANTISFIDKQRDEYILMDFNQKHSSKININSVVSLFLQKVKMTDKVEEKIPFFYKKMFVGSHATPQEIESRETEISQAKDAIQILKRNRGGAILILGEQLAGKKYFSDYIATQMLDKKIFFINPEIENNKVITCFENALNRTFDSDESLDSILEKTPSSTLVFNNIEKWGSEVSILVNLKKCIEKYSSKHNFIINCNLTFYSHLQTFDDYNDVVISTIFILPLRKDSFIDVFKLKHQAGGVKFVLNGVKENKLSTKKVNLLFQKYHFIYKGNIGLSFLSWINNIEKVEENEIYIKEPKALFFPEIPNSDWLVVLKLFVLYTEVSKVQMKELLNENINYISVLNQMKRINLIEEFKTGVYEITDEAKRYVSDYLKDKNIL